MSVQDQADKGDYRPCGLRSHPCYQIRQIGQNSMMAGLISHPNLCLAMWNNIMENLAIFIAPGLLGELQIRRLPAPRFKI